MGYRACLEWRKHAHQLAGSSVCGSQECVLSISLPLSACTCVWVLQCMLVCVCVCKLACACEWACVRVHNIFVCMLCGVCILPL